MSVLIVMMTLVFGVSLRPMEGVTISFIVNASLVFFNTSVHVINGSCQQCLCEMYTNTNYSSLNCFENNGTCHLHSQSDANKPFEMIVSPSTKFYFLSLPTWSPNTIASTLVYNMGELLWPFDSDYSDLSATYNFTPINQPSLSSNTINGYGNALHLNASLNQSLFLKNSEFNLANKSWTFEMWIYPTRIDSSGDYPIITQKESEHNNRFLQLILRHSKPLFGFFGDDVHANTTIMTSRWYHLAFVFDCPSHNQSIYVDGFIIATRSSHRCYEGVLGNLTIGFVSFSWIQADAFLDGDIDQISYADRSKSSVEILEAASLTAYFSFDNQSITDQGPLKIISMKNSTVEFVSRANGTALRIQNITNSYFQAAGFRLLGTDNASYSISIWIRPLEIPNSSASIVHFSSDANGLGWCISAISFRSTGHLIATGYSGIGELVQGPVVSLNIWTHVVVTYSQQNGLRLYTNGTFFNASRPYGYDSPDTFMYIIIGDALFGTARCVSTGSPNSHYFGDVDELRIYSRELTSSEILILSA